jgi:hypothetical protein
MRAIFLILIVAVVALILAVMSGMINLRQTEPAVAPGIETSDGKIVARKGQAPAFDIETGSIGVAGSNASVAVPKIEIKPGETRVAVPTIEVRRPGAPQAPVAPAAPAAPAPPAKPAN